MTSQVEIFPADLELEVMPEEGQWTSFQKRAVVLAVLAVILDGFDIQLLGVAIPALIREWGLTRSAFVPVIALGLVAMSIGTALSGLLGDRFGRRATLIGSMFLFGGATLATVLATSLPQFLVARLIASLGLGGAMPNAVALLSEFTPRRRRSFTVTVGMICTPLGGVFAGLVAASLLPSHGWQSLFLIGGILPLALALLLIAALPESPSFLMTRPGRRAASERFVPAPISTRVGYGALLAGAMRRDTLLLWMQFLGVLTAAYTVFNWLPTLLGKVGYDVAVGGAGLAAFNFGGIGGALIGALLMDRHGSRGLTIFFGASGFATSLVVSLLIGGGASAAIAIAGLFAAGMFIAGLQPMLFALAAHVYPDRMRATGVGTALALGRLGAIASSVIGAALIGIGAFAFFAFIAALMLMVAIALALLSGHVPGRSPQKSRPPQKSKGVS